MVQGRIIWAVGGSPFKGKPVLDKMTKQPKLDKNNNPMVNRGFGLAVHKDIFKDPANLNPGAVGEFWNAMYEEAWTLYPDRVIPKNFAWKRIDGDTDSDETGRMWSTKEGYAGHIVLPCTTNLNIAFYKFLPGETKPTLISEGIKVGDYVQVQLNIVAHPPMKSQDGSMGKPGMYNNPLSVLFLDYGQAIVSQQDGEDIFGSVKPAAPIGAQVVPDTAPHMGQMAQMPTAPAPMQQQQYAPPTPAAPVQPHYDVVPQQFHPQAQQQQYAPPTPAAPVPQFNQAPAGPPMPPGAPRQ